MEVRKLIILQITLSLKIAYNVNVNGLNNFNRKVILDNYEMPSTSSSNIFNVKCENLNGIIDYIDASSRENVAINTFADENEIEIPITPLILNKQTGKISKKGRKVNHKSADVSQHIHATSKIIKSK